MMASPNMYIALSEIPILRFHLLAMQMSKMLPKTLTKVVSQNTLLKFQSRIQAWNSTTPTQAAIDPAITE